MMKPLVCASILLACGLIAVGCGSRKEEPSASPRKGTAAGAKKDGSMAAKVNGAVITRADIDQAVQALMNRFSGQMSPEQMAGMKPVMWKQALESLINQRVLVQEADREGIQADKKGIDAQVKEISSRAPSGEAFQKLLASAGITEVQLRHDIGQDLKIEALLDKKAPKTQGASDKEVKAYYRDNPEKFKVPERLRASHILVKVNPGESAEDRAQKRLKLAGLRGRIEKGEDFAKLAGENSDCPSKSQGGDLGYFEKGKMAKPFEDAVFAMKIGQVSDVVETQFGYHLIKLTGHEEARVIPLEQARDKVVTFLNRQKRQKVVGDYLQKLRGSATIEYAEGPRA
jgi:peptidyl-prolyl cis-trans isomerase C